MKLGTITNLLIMLSVLTSCGGGSGGSSSASLQSSSQSSVASVFGFTNKETAYLVTGETYSNIATGGTGTEEVVYSSDKPDVASVDSVGKVSVHHVGTALITAQKQLSTDSYLIKVVPKEFSLSAWIGKSNAEISIPDDLLSGSLFHSSEMDCFVRLYKDCSIGGLLTLAPSLVDSQWNLTDDMYYSFIHGKREAKQFGISKHKVDTIWDYKIVNFKGKFYLIGGFEGGAGPLGQIRSSMDGVNWVEVVANPPFGKRSFYNLIEFKEKLWLFGGAEYSVGEKNDAWSTSDGISWQQETNDTGLPVRNGNQMVVWKNKLWMFGGNDAHDNFYSDVWSSNDGKVWRREVAASSFPHRANFQLVVWNEKLVLVGGFDEDNHKQDIWTSNDGVKWIAASIKMPGTDIGEWSVAVHNNKLWFFSLIEYLKPCGLWSTSDLLSWQLVKADFPASGALFKDDQGLHLVGHQNDSYFTAWHSFDGLDWKQSFESMDQEGRQLRKIFSFKNLFWMMGGYDGTLGYRKDVWSSEDALSWHRVAEATPFVLGSNVNGVTYNDQLWLYTDTPAGNSTLRELWSTADGITWEKHLLDSSMLPGRLVIHKNQLWILPFAGQNFAWVSVDGDNWEPKSDQAAFDGNQIKVVSFNDRLLTIYGSIDGQTPQISSNLHFDYARQGYDLIVYKERLWLINGGGGIDEGFDIWSTADGNLWSKEVSAPEFGVRSNSQLVVNDNNLFLFDGGSYKYFYDVWKTSNGIEWRKGKKLNFYFEPFVK